MVEATEIKRRLAELEVYKARSKNIEKALREIEKRYRRLVENVTDAIFTLDSDWTFTYISHGLEKITGYNIQDMIWHPFSEIVAPECYESILDSLKMAASDEAKESYETNLIHKDGRIIHVELFIMPIFDTSKQSIGSYLVAVQDLTDRKQAIEELLKAQKLESIGSLAGGIAHDFNNVLTGILGNISLAKMYLESEKSSDKALARLLEAEDASIKAKNLTQRLLTFAKGGAPIKKLMPLSDLLRDSVGLALSGSKAKCEFSIPGDLWDVEVDKDQINQVINNVIINSDQAMPEGGIINVIAENIDIKAKDNIPVKPGQYVKISIEDQGIGISPENLPRIFDPYFTTKEKRSGLGLATAYSVVKRHDGFINAESRLGIGTTIYIYLPASTEKSLPEESKKEEIIAPPKPVEAKPISGKGKILIMDDEEIIRELLKEMLTNLGYETNSAAGGTEAIGLYKEAKDSGNPYDAIIVDLTIPGGMGGKETIQRIKEMDPNIKAIVSSGYSNDPIMAEYQKYGFKGVIAKPYKINELSEIIHKVINS